MFNSGKKKVVFTHTQVRLLMVSLNLFRNKLIQENKYTDAVDDILVAIKSKMKVSKNDLGIMMLALENYDNTLLDSNNLNNDIEETKLKIIDIYKTIKK